MEFDGEFESEGVPPADAWVMMSDPIAVRNALKGCRYITRMDDPGFSFEDDEPEEGLKTLPEAGSRIEWGAEADVSGRVAQLGSRVIDPVANKIVSGFFTEIEQQMTDVEASDEGGGTQRLRNML